MLTFSVYLYYILFFFTKIISSQASCSCDLPDSDFAADVTLTYYKCNNETPATIAYPITAPNDLLTVLENKRTIFYIFGYMENPRVTNVQTIMTALCYGRTDNVVLLDWSKFTVGLYPLVFRNAEKVGSLFAQSLQLLVNNGLNVSNIYIIGHSLGSHIAGFAGKCNNFTIPRITGLDPANPFYYVFGCYLKSTDAAWVDVIHTDAGGYGSAITIGTVDYYINNGIRFQPDCPIFPLPGRDLCSHQKSVELYAETKYQPNKFTAVQCSYLLRICDNKTIGVGYAASNVKGSFCLNTK